VDVLVDNEIIIPITVRIDELTFIQISLEEKSLQMEAVSVTADLKSNRDGGVPAKQKNRPFFF